MSSFSEFERSQIMSIKQREERDLDCCTCPKCGSQWFEQVHCNRYKNDHSVVLGQPVPERPGSVPYIILRCVLCNNLVEPRVLHATRDIGGRDYDHFLDTLEGKFDKRKELEKAGPNAVSSEEL